MLYGDLKNYFAKPVLRVLAIETSCDETAVAIVEHDRSKLCGRIVSEKISSQLSAHSSYGGIVPEIAARLHVDCLDILIKNCLSDCDYDLSKIDIFAVTSGPGLVGGLLGGIVTARGLAFALDKECLSINHLEGHALTPRLFEQVDFPYLLVLLSGGHSHIYLVRDVGFYDLIGATLDDAAGEAFDKSSRFLGLDSSGLGSVGLGSSGIGSSGGALIEIAAKKNNHKLINFPKPLFGKSNANFSFSGLKTAFVRKAESMTPLSENDIANLAASLQETMSKIIVDRTKTAIGICESKYCLPKIERVVLSGGVAANMKIRADVEKMCQSRNIRLFAPPIKYCGDNAAMIAWAAIERLRKQCIIENNYNYQPQSRWDLQEMNTNKKGDKKSC